MKLNTWIQDEDLEILARREELTIGPELENVLCQQGGIFARDLYQYFPPDVSQRWLADNWPTH